MCFIIKLIEMTIFLNKKIVNKEMFYEFFNNFFEKIIIFQSKQILQKDSKHLCLYKSI